MKKLFFIVVVAMFGIVSGNAQFKDNGFKVIGEISSGFSSASADGESGFGMISPGAEISLGANVTPQFYVGAGLGYNALIGVSDFEGTDHEAKAFVHGRFYFSPEGNGAIANIKIGYKRDFTSEVGALDVFVGPGYMFGEKFSLSVGYAGSFYDGVSLHGGAIKFGIEF